MFSVSLQVSLLLRSTATPIDLAVANEVKPANFNSAAVNPLPNFILELYLLVCPLTAGLNLFVGLKKLKFKFKY
jgi:hypothetical protein